MLCYPTDILISANGSESFKVCDGTLDGLLDRLDRLDRAMADSILDKLTVALGENLELPHVLLTVAPAELDALWSAFGH